MPKSNACWSQGSKCHLLVQLFAAMSLTAAAGGPKPVIKTVVPTEINAPLNNPYMGWGLWAGSRNVIGAGRYGQSTTVEENTTRFGDDAPLFSWILVDWQWADLEPQEGQFNWKNFDAVISYWAPRGKQIVLRFWVTDDPGWDGKPGGISCPEWMWAKGLRSREYVGEGGVKRREPDYADPSYEKVYLPALKNLISAFAERYDKSETPFIFVQVMGYGHWADWATWYSHYSFPNLKAKHDLLVKIMNLYIDTFKHIRLFEFSGPDWDRAEPKTLEDLLYSKALDVAVSHGFGLIWTGIMDGLGGPWDRVMKDRYWRQNPIIAEGNWCYEDMISQLKHGTADENLDVSLGWHANFAHFYFDSVAYRKVMQNDRPFLERGLQSGGLGYRLTPTSLSWPEELPSGHLLALKQNWVNRNVGRLYVRHPLKLYLTDSDGNEKFSEVDRSFDETSWLQGETHQLTSVFHLKKDLAPGIYDARIALTDESGTPRIYLPIQGADSQKRYRVGTIRILSPQP